MTIDYHETDPGLLFSTYYKVISKISKTKAPVRVGQQGISALPRAVNDLEKALFLLYYQSYNHQGHQKSSAHTHASIWPSHTVGKKSARRATRRYTQNREETGLTHFFDNMRVKGEEAW